jgi:5-(carboxyamino)imidazole ribonucleotide mutase
MAIGKAGAVNAGLLAAQMLGVHDKALMKRIEERRTNMRDAALESSGDLL